MSYDHLFCQIGKTYISVNHTDHKEPIFDRVDITKSPREIQDSVKHHVMSSLLAHSMTEQNGRFPSGSIRLQWDATSPLTAPLDTIAQAIMDGIKTISRRTKNSLVVSVWVPKDDKGKTTTKPSRDSELFNALKTAFNKAHSPKL